MAAIQKQDEQSSFVVHRFWVSSTQAYHEMSVIAPVAFLAELIIFLKPKVHTILLVITVLLGLLRRQNFGLWELDCIEKALPLREREVSGPTEVSPGVWVWIKILCGWGMSTVSAKGVDVPVPREHG